MVEWTSFFLITEIPGSILGSEIDFRGSTLIVSTVPAGQLFSTGAPWRHA
jgi:hypothetical protein